MNYTFFVKISDCCRKCIEDSPQLMLGKWFFFRPAFLDNLDRACVYFSEISLGCVFHDDVDIIEGEEGFVVLNDIGMFDEFEGLELPKGLYLLFLLHK